MGRIGSILSSAERRLLYQLTKIDAASALASFRLATQRRVNYPRDDPAAFLTLSLFQQRLNAAGATMANVTAASSRLTQAQTAIGQIRSQLNTIRTELLKDENRTLTPSQRAQSQATIDAAITQIDVLAGTRIDGRAMLDGSADFIVSGRNASQVRELYACSKPPGSSMSISGTVTQAATQAELVYTGDAGSPPHPTADATFTLTGKRGSTTFSVTTAQTLSQVADAINEKSHLTGVKASVDANQLTFSSVDYGSAAGISITVTSGTFNVAGTGTAVDAQATINGQSHTGNGNHFSVSDNGFVFQMEVAGGFSGEFAAMTVSGDALRYQLSTSLAHPDTLAIPSLLAARLGGTSGRLDQIATGGPYSGLDANTSRAIRIVDEALGKLDLAEGVVDGFYNASVTSSSSLLTQLQSDLEDSIAATDGFSQEEETALLDHYSDLAANTVAGLTILGQQRSLLVDMIKQVAGLL